MWIRLDCRAEIDDTSSVVVIGCPLGVSWSQPMLVARQSAPITDSDFSRMFIGYNPTNWAVHFRVEIKPNVWFVTWFNGRTYQSGTFDYIPENFMGDQFQRVKPLLHA